MTTKQFLKNVLASNANPSQWGKYGNQTRSSIFHCKIINWFWTDISAFESSMKSPYPWETDTCPEFWHSRFLPQVSILDWGHFVRVKLVLRYLLVDSQLTSPNDTLTSPALLIHTSTGSTWLKCPLKPPQIEITLLIRVLSMWLKTFCEDTNHKPAKKK